MTGTYAASTSVSSEKSRAEIERTLTRYGATSFAYGWNPDRAVIQFTAESRQIRFVLTMPPRDHPSITRTPSTQKWRTPAQAEAAYEQAIRQRWRALALVIKAKLEAVEAGISVFEQEFLAYVVLPDGSTVGEFMAPQVADAYKSGEMPVGLPMLASGERPAASPDGGRTTL